MKRDTERESAYLNKNPGYKKGTNVAGGGGPHGGGGKRTRPLGGWEKGDVRRDQPTLGDEGGGGEDQGSAWRRRRGGPGHHVG